MAWHFSVRQAFWECAFGSAGSFVVSALVAWQRMWLSAIMLAACGVLLAALAVGWHRRRLRADQWTRGA